MTNPLSRLEDECQEILRQKPDARITVPLFGMLEEAVRGWRKAVSEPSLDASPIDDGIGIANMKMVAENEPSLLDELIAIADKVPEEEWDKLPRDFAENFRKVVGKR